MTSPTNQDVSTGEADSVPAVSVVIPTYNHRQFILDTLGSVFSQTFTDYEVIVVNDGSPDDTAAALQPLIAAGKIRYFEQANAGQAAARNFGISNARGEYIALLDDDDLWPADRLLWQVDALQTEPEAALAYGFATVFGNEVRPPIPGEDAPRGWVRDAFLLINCIYSPGQTLIRRRFLSMVNGFDATIWGADDWDLYIRLAECAPFVYKYQCALHYRLHGDNASKDIWKMYVNACKVLRKNFGVIPRKRDFPLWLRSWKKIKVGYSESLRRRAKELASQGKTREAQVMLIQSVRAWPISVRRWSVIRELLTVLLYSRAR